jgi:hypothetical protein
MDNATISQIRELQLQGQRIVWTLGGTRFPKKKISILQARIEAINAELDRLNPNDEIPAREWDKEWLAITAAQQDIQKTAAETLLKQQELKDKQNPQKVAGFTSMKDVFDAENKLADDHKGQSKDFIGVRDAYSRLNTSLDAANASAPATLAAATTFMKLLDPGSVVRESELGMALAATGTLDRVQNTWQRMQKGQVLTPMQVAEFKSVAEKLYGAAEQNQKGLDEHYATRAKAYGLDPNKVIGDYYIKKPKVERNGITPLQILVKLGNTGRPANQVR